MTVRHPIALNFRLPRLLSVVILAVLSGIASRLQAEDDDFDSYKIKIIGYWFHSEPSGTLEGANAPGTIDITKDLGFHSYSTFTGKVDWKFTRKNHLYFVGSPVDFSRQTVLTRTIEFQGHTFVAGLTTQSDLRTVLYGPGYQYDIIRRRRGHFGLAAQLDVIHTHASITATGTLQVNGGGVQQGPVSANGSLLAPVPVFGPEFRLYFTHRVYLQGNGYGMYFFGYGNFLSSSGGLGLRLAKHVGVNVGYQLGSRLTVKNNSSSDRIGLRLTQKGTTAGFEFPF
jgi:hypothetical protein